MNSNRPIAGFALCLLAGAALAQTTGQTTRPAAEIANLDLPSLQFTPWEPATPLPFNVGDSYDCGSSQAGMPPASGSASYRNRS